MNNPPTPTIGDLSRRIAAGTDPMELLAECTARIAQADDAIFITLTTDRAEQEAAAARKRQQSNALLGPLDGVPMAWKDLIDVKGTTTTCASAILKDRPPAKKDAPCVANLAKHGMVSVGKTNLTEFAFSGLGLNPHFGTPANACDPRVPRVPGGSSSGSAVAVATGLVPCAIGTDTGGSVRVPAAFNGIVGYKSSEGRVSLKGIKPLASTFDTVGPLCHTVEDCVMVDCGLRGAPINMPPSVTLTDVEVLVPENYINHKMEDAVAANFERTVRALQNAGCRITRAPAKFLDDYSEQFADHGRLTALEAYENWQQILNGPEAERMDQRVRNRMLTGRELAERADAVRATRQQLIRAFEAELGDRILLTPTVPFVAPEIAPLDADPELHRVTNMRTIRNTMPGNYLRTCGLSVPNGTNGSGMPTAVLLTCRWNADDRLLATGLEVEPIIRNV